MSGMVSGKEREPDYNQIQSRMDNALTFLRKELTQMRAQDEALLKQLLHIHDTIATLSGTKRNRRQSCGDHPSRSRDTSHILSRSLPSKDELRRRLSAPVETEPTDDEGVESDDKSLDEDAFDSRADEKNRDSFGSLDEIDLDLEKEMADFLSPLPSTLDMREKRNSIQRIVRFRNPNRAINSSSVNNNNNQNTHNKNSLAHMYDISYGELLKRSSKLYKEVQRERRETGHVDQRKMAALKLFL